VTERPSGSISVSRCADIYLHDRAAVKELLAVERLPNSWREFAAQTIERAN